MASKEEQKYLDVIDALIAWFKSQELDPTETVRICEVYIAQMIVNSSSCAEEAEERHQECDANFRDFARRTVNL